MINFVLFISFYYSEHGFKIMSAFSVAEYVYRRVPYVDVLEESNEV
jgi:hypothetical protein